MPVYHKGSTVMVKAEKKGTNDIWEISPLDSGN